MDKLCTFRYTKSIKDRSNLDWRLSLNFIAFKTRVKSILPVADLISKPKSDFIYKSLFEESLPKMHKSMYAKELNYETISWIDRLALKTQVSIKRSNLDWSHGYFLYSTIAKYSQDLSSKNVTVFESGSAKGFSALVMAKAINDVNKIPKITSIDIIDGGKSIYWNAIGDEHGRRTRSELLENYHDLNKCINFMRIRSSKLGANNFIDINFDIAFLDGAHTFSDVKKEFNFVKRKLNKNGIIIFDDYDSLKYPGIVKFINSLEQSRVTIINSDKYFKVFAVYR
jgi:predicted O-methyltransferase YrrM